MVSLRTAMLTSSLFASLILLSGGAVAIAAPELSPLELSSSPAAVAPADPSIESLPLQDQPARSVPRSAITRKVRRDLARRLNVQPKSIILIEATPETWPDQCLGLARPYERCAGGEVSGWRIQFASGQQQWVYRTNSNARRLGMEPLAGSPDFGRGDFSIEASQKLLDTAAHQVDRPLADLQVLEVQPAVWNGCLGIFEPDRACTMQAIAGFRTVISDGRTIWVYHLSEDGSQIAQNAIASGAPSPVSTLFVPIGPEPEAELNAEIIFQSQLSGDLAGSAQTTVLTADGLLYREQSSLSAQAPVRTVIRQLSSEEVTAFQDVLKQQRFSNLNRLRYLTDAAFADYPTTRLEAPGTRVDYIDLEEENLPISLKRAIAAWQAIAQSLPQ
ncbi:MAG: hypothetical protein WA783_00780 [Phormidesmis sp.]